MAADEAFYQARGYHKVGEFYLHPDDEARADQYRIVPGGLYRPLYEGRMVHLYDHAQKAYVEGEGRRAVWRTLALGEKHLHSRVYVCATEAGQTPSDWRIGFCDVTGATNERTTLAALIPPGQLCGNKVPTLTVGNLDEAVLLTAIMNSVVFDWFIRFRISTTLNAHYLYKTPIPTLATLAPVLPQMREAVLRLSLTTPEFAAWVPGWSYTWAETDPWKRAELRATLDVLVASAYGLTTTDFARVLTTFPLLDRDQPALEGDCFVTEGTADDTGAVEVPWGWVQTKPRSFVTRDLALLTWLRHKGEAVPPDLQGWYRDKVGLDPEGPESRFRIGTFKDLVTRVEMARQRGAVAYVPTGAAEEEGEDQEGEEA
ncbi:MAG: hypothetical protein WCG80_14065 [Spirochaetales bacterium]